MDNYCKDKPVSIKTVMIQEFSENLLIIIEQYSGIQGSILYKAKTSKKE